MKVFVIKNDSVKEGATVVMAGKTPAIVVGQEGRGREEGALPVAGATAGDTLNACLPVRERTAMVLHPLDAPRGDAALVVLRTPIGYRGSNAHTGDIVRFRSEEAAAEWGPFPLEVLATGQIAEGQAGGMGSGEQHIAIARAGQTWRVAIRGRRYGLPTAYYYHFDGQTIHVTTMAERKRLEALGQSPFPPLPMSDEVEQIAVSAQPLTLRANMVERGLPVDGEGNVVFTPHWGMARDNGGKVLAVSRAYTEEYPLRVSRQKGVVLLDDSPNDAEVEIVLIQEYVPGTGAKRWPAFYVESDERLTVLGTARTSGGSGWEGWTLALAPMGWAASVARQFVNERDAGEQKIVAP